MFYDTHAHLGDRAFAADLLAVLERARAAGVTRIICIATDLASSRRALELAGQFPNVYAAVGWHPSDAAEAPEDWRQGLRDLARHPKVVALGETGLDYYRLPSRRRGGTAAEDEPIKRKQAELFRQHLEVAAELGLNCVIHQRDSFEDALALLRPYADKLRGVFHCFAGDAPALERILALGSLVSYTGILTFKNGQNIRDALAATPRDRFMLETDCPYLAPEPHRRERCEPAFLSETAAVAAQVQGCSLEQLAAATSTTADQFFFSKLAA